MTLEPDTAGEYDTTLELTVNREENGRGAEPIEAEITASYDPGQGQVERTVTIIQDTAPTTTSSARSMRMWGM